MLERIFINAGREYQYEEFKDKVAFIHKAIPIIRGELRLLHFRTPATYVARIIGRDPFVMFKRQFLRPRMVRYKTKKFPCGQRKFKFEGFQFPFPDGIYEIQQKGNKTYKRLYPRDSYQRFYLESKNGAIKLIPLKEVKKLFPRVRQSETVPTASSL